jgi:hypothetical protein
MEWYKNLPTSIYSTRWQANDHSDNATTTPWQLKCYVASCNTQSPSRWPWRKHHNNYDVLLQVATHDHLCDDHDKNITIALMFYYKMTTHKTFVIINFDVMLQVVAFKTFTMTTKTTLIQ